jgi:O-antigen/teichoic acid export membrane protein
LNDPILAQGTLSSPEAGGRVIRGSALRVAGGAAGIAVGVASAALLLRHLGVAESGRYVTVLSLVGIAVAMIDTGLNVSASGELALREENSREDLYANVLSQRLLVTPIALIVIVAFAALAGYPARMVAGTALAGSGVFMVSIANAVLVRLTVDLRNGGLAFVDFVRQVVSLAGFAVLVAEGAHLIAFFAVQIIVGLVVLALTPLLVGVSGLVRPRLDHSEQRALLSRALPVAAALGLGQIYFRLVIVLMSLISNPRQTGYFGGSLRAMEALINLPILVAGVALPLLAAAARDDRARFRRAISGLGEGAIIAGVLVALVAVRAAEPVMELIGGRAFAHAGAVLRIQVLALLFIALYQLWTASLVALSKQRELIRTNALGLLGLALFAVPLILLFGAIGGASASVLGDALLASLIYQRLRAAGGPVMVSAGFLGRVLLAAILAGATLLIPGLSNLLSAALVGVVFLGAGQLIGMLPSELHEAFEPFTGRLRRKGAAG